ncbi:MAG: GIY-YIG nuclease family protein [Candidatus Magasanikbacteria bacterium]|jgi:putative endonuclease|nr:GIY-YIG nuclease family protein [Candidatus Magasanikbacteria bacterium]MBT4315248.1 GIY-YIG nuclease family protein [Candidatus Magasanikbacteria bacterium]MBT4547106.1 GIY-YIG nuclease family protein [Candidatus Magasanikbacteria bacterium]MBT6819607.1 GIY-YIG nuclease family protein [Candidatus Magasanikbacteria bacterium]
MYYVYILLMSNKKFYIGYTSNLKRRITEHRSGGNKTTKKFLPVKLIFYECYLNKDDATRREGYFKTSKGKTALRIMLTKTLENN